MFFSLLLRPTLCFLFGSLAGLRGWTGCCENDSCSEGLCKNARHLFLLERKLTRIFFFLSHVDTINTEFYCLLTYWRLEVYRVWLFIVLHLSQTNTVLKAEELKSFWTLGILGPLQAISVGLFIQGQVSIHNGKPTFCILGNSSIENKRVISEFT